MDVLAALKTMIETSGTNPTKLARDIGRSSRYVSTTMQKGSDIQCSNMARMAGVMGYELVLRGHGEELVIDPRPDGEPSDLA